MATQLGTIIEQIRERTDLQNSEFVTDSEITDYLNYSLGELYGLLVNSYGGTYFATSIDMSIPAGEELSSTDFPDDMYKLLGVDMYLGNAPSQNRLTLQPFNFNERNRANNLNIAGYATQASTNYRYHVLGTKLMITPPSQGNLLKLWYVPVAPQFATNTTGVVTTSPNLSSGIVVLAPGYKTFRVGEQVQKVIAGLPGGTIYYVTAVSNNLITLSLNPGGTGANLTGQISSGDTLYSPSVDVFQTFGNNATLNGWLEYVVVDVSIKLKTKEETDTSMFVRQKALLTERIRNESQNRDIGSPAVVSDIYAVGTITDSGVFGYGYGGILY